MFDNEWDVEGWLDSAMFPTRILKCKVEVSADRRWETELGNRVGKQSWETELGNGADTRSLPFNPQIAFSTRNPRFAESAISTQKDSNTRSRFTFSPSPEQRQLLVFVVVQRVRFLVLIATSFGPF